MVQILKWNGEPDYCTCGSFHAQKQGKFLVCNGCKRERGFAH